HGRDHHGDLVARIARALDARGDGADPFQIGDGGTAKLLYQQGHLAVSAAPGPPRCGESGPGLSTARVYIFGRKRASTFACRSRSRGGMDGGGDAADLDIFAVLAV